MKCESVREKLTAYLDGELEGERGSAVRGHLRSCDACRAIAADEAALRDGLRALPPLDPPASLWAGVQQRLAAEEVKDAERPAWGRALSWLRPRLPQLALGSVALAAAIVLLAVRMQRDDEPTPSPSVVHVPPPKIEAARQGGKCATGGEDGDVTQALAAERTNTTGCYAQEARELLELAAEARPEWPADRQRDFDLQLETLEKRVAAATDERPRQDAYRKLIRYLRRAVVRDDVALANVGGVQ
jgi:anti-sigma factor RsiW